MKIDNKILSLPPYISTQWKHVDAIYLRGATLVVSLVGGESINIPGLNAEILQLIFVTHAEYLEKEAQLQPTTHTSLQQVQEQSMGLPLFSQAFTPGDGAFQFGISTMDGLFTAMEHNATQANAPDLPHEILQKIGAIVKIVVPEDVLESFSAVKDCNCPHCQITRMIAGEVAYPEHDKENGVMRVKETASVYRADTPPPKWMIKRVSEQVFEVIGEFTQFEVKLGEIVVCTCGQSGCEHIIAVLRSDV